jgi:hypothetical protein
MKKNRVFSVRLSSGMKRAMELAAKRDRRSIASLLEKIVADYLAKEGIDWEIIQKDRRVYPRKDVSLPARLRIQKSPKGYYETEALVQNMSLGGAYVTYINGHTYPLAPASRVNLVMRIPRSVAPLDLDCRVVHISKNGGKIGVGIQYGLIAKENLAIIDRFLM